MSADTPNTLLPPLPTERRQAIWPWLVMPLVALGLFYGLREVKKEHLPENTHISGPAAAHAGSATDDGQSQ